MKSKDIKFAREISFMALKPENFSNIKPQLVDFIISNNNLYIYYDDETKLHPFAIELVSADVDKILYEINHNKQNALLRLDLISSINLGFTFHVFSNVENFNLDNPLTIVLDRGLDVDLKKNDIKPENALKFVLSQLLIDEIYDYKIAFAYHNEKNDKLQLIGANYIFSVEKTNQNYLHFVSMNKRRDLHRIDYPISMLKGSININNQLMNNQILNETTNKQYNELIKQDTEFIKLWDLYNDLELESKTIEAEEMGYLKYSSYEYTDLGNVIFHLDNGYIVKEDFLKEGFCYDAIDSKFFNKDNPLDYNSKMAVVIGSEFDNKCKGSNEFIIREDSDSSTPIPKNGYIVPSLNGSITQSNRRKEAEKNILQNKCQLPGLKNIIQAGSIVGVETKHYNAITSDLEEKVFGNKEFHFTETQKSAIDIALNTPDIAIIQGPPGTGKTTIIKGLTRRIDQLYGSKAKLLITSTQHVAVENACDGVSYGGVTANLVSVKKGQKDENSTLYKWIDDMRSSCDLWLEKYGQSDKKQVRQIFKKISYINDTIDVSEKIKLLCEIKELLNDFSFNIELDSKISNLIIKCKESHESSIVDHELLEIVEKQIFDSDAFIVNGKSNMSELQMYLKFGLSDVAFKVPSYWNELKEISEKNHQLEELLIKYKEDCNNLKNLALGGTSKGNEKINDEIKELSNDIKKYILSKENNQDNELKNIIWNFKNELSNISNVENIIQAYSKINAATCQQSANRYLSPSMDGMNEIYDYVIVDEAARSNPLDLFIPMCMGKKIILIGDHKQLPHMLEEDVVNDVVKKTGKDISPELRKSLFSKLYEAVSKEDKKAGIKRTIMLNEQRRMHSEICDVVNLFYNGQIETLCKDSEKTHCIKEYLGHPLVWIDIPYSDKDNKSEYKKSHGSIHRDIEVAEVEKQLAIISKSMDLTPVDKKNKKVGIITFYSDQAAAISKIVKQKYYGLDISVGTVDAFQGKEYDIVILSTVRSNDPKDFLDEKRYKTKDEVKRARVGFLDNDNRLCVAFSRAKKLLITIGDSKTVACDGDEIQISALAELYKKSMKEVR